MKKYNIRDNFFEVIDTEEKAYWLGFLYADGYIRSGRLNFIRLKLAIRDIDHMEKFKESIGSSHRIEIYEDSNNPYCQITIGCKKMVIDLIANGCVTNKGFKIRLPNIGDSLMPHFIRGYFDGDGCVSHKNRNSYCVSIVSNIRFINDLKIYLGYGNININKKNQQLANLNIYKETKKFRKYIYNTSTIYLQRKFEYFNRMDTKHVNKIWCPNNYIVTNIESGERNLINNLADFCRKNDLSESCMGKVASKKYNSHRGFICEKI
jgi:hypothetical protein